MSYLNVWRAWEESGRSKKWAIANYVSHRSMLRAGGRAGHAGRALGALHPIPGRMPAKAFGRTCVLCSLGRWVQGEWQWSCRGAGEMKGGRQADWGQDGAEQLAGLRPALQYSCRKIGV